MLWAPVAFLLGLAAWLVATLAPVALAIASWRLAKKAKFGWPVHVGFLPVALGVVWLAVELLFFAAGDTGDSPPGLGLAILPAILVLVSTVAYYYIALTVQLTRRALSHQRRT